MRAPSDFDKAIGDATAATWAGVQIECRLVRSPYAGEVYESELFMWPVSEAREYRGLTMFETDNTLPILLSPSQRDRWLAELITAARRRLPGLRLTVLRMGGAMAQLPAELLNQSVLLTHDPEPAAKRALSSGCAAVLSIWQDLRTDGIDDGENRMVMTVQGSNCAADFIRFVRDEPLCSSLETVAIREQAAAT